MLALVKTKIRSLKPSFNKNITGVLAICSGLVGLSLSLIMLIKPVQIPEAYPQTGIQAVELLSNHDFSDCTGAINNRPTCNPWYIGSSVTIQNTTCASGNCLAIPDAGAANHYISQEINNKSGGTITFWASQWSANLDTDYLELAIVDRTNPLNFCRWYNPSNQSAFSFPITSAGVYSANIISTATNTCPINGTLRITRTDNDCHGGSTCRINIDNVSFVGEQYAPPPPPTASPTPPPPTASPTPPPPGSTNLLLNPGFELDNNSDSIPDNWTFPSNYYGRSRDQVKHGNYSLKQSTTGQQSFAVEQIIPNVIAGKQYTLSAWVFIPPTSDTFTYQLNLVWQTPTGNINKQIKSFSKATGTWIQVPATLVAPATATSAMIRLKVNDFSATVYTDNLVFALTTNPSVNLLINPSFETDANGDEVPDNWTIPPYFKRVSAPPVPQQGNFMGKHSATGEVTYAVQQTVGGIIPGKTYSFKSYAQIPQTTDKFQITYLVVWRNAAKKTISTSTIKSLSSPTSGWTQTNTNLVAPAYPSAAAYALVRMKVTGLSTVIYVDSLEFKRAN